MEFPRCKEELLKLGLSELDKDIPRWFEEDSISNDITTDTLGISGGARALYFSKDKKGFVVAGLHFIKKIFEKGYETMKEKLAFKSLGLKFYVEEGEVVIPSEPEKSSEEDESVGRGKDGEERNLHSGKKGKEILEVIGDVKLLLALERLTLNLLSRLCGIATETKNLVDIAERFGVQVWATRKTTPGLRTLEKYAVCVGGGFPHRKDLSDGILIKDNHISAVGGISRVMKTLLENIDDVRYHNARYTDDIKFPIEIEVESEHELDEVLRYLSELQRKDLDLSIMLDNFSPSSAEKCIKKIREFERKHNIKIFVEVSGGINPDNIEDYLRAKPDRISAGYITFSPRTPDISVDVEVVG